jgi:16S rRNA (guanine1207-N2)-methyltransferase
MLPLTDGRALPGRILFLGAEPHAALHRCGEILGWQPFKPKADAWERAGFGRTDSPEGKWPLVMILPGKSRDETLAWFARGRDLLEPGGELLVAMPNGAGAARFEKELARAAGGVESLQKNKCRAFRATFGEACDEAVFAEWRELGRRRRIPGTDFVVEAGVFSADGIDPGSLFLAEHLPAYLRGAAADLGAGWGYLSDALLRRCPKVEGVDLFEADARALDCARENLSHHPQPLCFHWHDVTAGLPGRYDTILANPPFHSGQATDIGLGQTFIRVAAASLNRGGRLLLVANRQLPYEVVLEASGLAWRNAAENGAFKLLFAERRSA